LTALDLASIHWPWGSVREVFFYTSLGNDLRTYLSLIVTDCNGERSFSKLKKEEWTKEHH